MRYLLDLADEIRQFVYNRYIKHAKEKGETNVTVISGTIHDEMRLKDRMPSVCQALRGKKFQTAYSVSLIQEIRLPSVQLNSSTNRFFFRTD